MPDLSTLTDEELNTQYRAYSAELQRRYDMARIPQEITQLATQGREIGVEESAMIDAVTNPIGHPLDLEEPQE